MVTTTSSIAIQAPSRNRRHAPQIDKKPEKCIKLQNESMSAVYGEFKLSIQGLAVLYIGTFSGRYSVSGRSSPRQPELVFRTEFRKIHTMRD